VSTACSPEQLVKRHLPRSRRAALTMFRGLEGEFRDWDAIRDWASQIARELRAEV
jgi:hypothetical protein